MNKVSYQDKNAPAIVCIGGGTGLSTMLRGLKSYTPKLTAIVTVTDDGGGSGVLRDELGMPPPGDIRSCILALANMEPTMEKLLTYRFESGHLEGQCFGNLFLAAMNGISETFDQAVSATGEVLAITGRVLPVTNEDIRLKVEFEDGTDIIGESKIFSAKHESNNKIKKVHLIPENPPALAESIKAIEDADMIILGPGSLYTSIIPNLLVDGIAKTIEESTAVKLYVANIMTQIGETENYSVSDHIKELFNHSNRKLFDVCLSNSVPIPEEILNKYREEGAEQIFADRCEIEQLGVEVFESHLASSENNFVRHNSQYLGREIMRILHRKVAEKAYFVDRIDNL